MNPFVAFNSLIFYTKIVGLAPISDQYSLTHIIYNLVVLVLSNIILISVKIYIYSRVINIFIIFQGFFEICPITFASAGFLFFMNVSYKKSLVMLELFSQTSKVLGLDTRWYQRQLQNRIFIPTTILFIAVVILDIVALCVCITYNDGIHYIFMIICHGIYQHQSLLVILWYTNLCYVLKEHFLHLNKKISNLDYRTMIRYTILHKKLRCCEKIQNFRKISSSLMTIVKELNSAYGFPILTYLLDVLQSSMFASFIIIWSLSKISMEPNILYEVIFFLLILLWFALKAILVLKISSGTTQEVSYCKSLYFFIMEHRVVKIPKLGT